MHPIKSINARAQGYTMQHFSQSKYAKELRKFHNIHSGEACFIIGNGPSLSSEDLSQIQKAGIDTFAFNRIYLMFDKTVWRPTYYVSQDEKTLKNSIDEVNGMNLPFKFIPLFHKFYHNIQLDSAEYFKLLSDKNKMLFSEDISEYIGDSTTVAYTAAQIAVYMGYKRMYLLGVDHNFSTYQNDKGEIIQDTSVSDYFTDNYNRDKNQLYIPNLDASTRAFCTMKEYCDIHGIEVYNATRGGKLEVFPRADFDKVINEL